MIARTAVVTLCLLLGCRCTAADLAARSAPRLEKPMLAIAKVYGAGGVAGLEGYQSALFVADDPPTLLTIDSPVLEWGSVAVVDAYGDRSEARVAGRDGSTGLALLELTTSVTPPAVLPLDGDPPRRADRVWALSNAFGIATGDEPVTLQRARIAALAPMPSPIDPTRARPTVGAAAPGTPVLLLDAVTSNPGAGGGAVVDLRGALVGVLGAETRSPVTGAWLSYALPTKQAREAVQRMRDTPDGGSTLSGGLAAPDRDAMRSLGLRLIPAISDRTPAYVEYVTEGSPASQASCRPDDLIVAVDGATAGSATAAEAAIGLGLQRTGQVEITVLRGDRLLRITLTPDAP